MTAKRDESRDVFVVTKFGQPLRVYSGDTQIIDSPDGAEECAHYVLGSQYAALETKNAGLKQSLAALEKERDELRKRLKKQDELAVEVFHDEDRDGPHVLAEAYLEYRCVKCGEQLCPDGSDEALDGLVCDINGYTIQCRKCGAEYIGYTIDTPKLALIQGDL